jgi:hypothetical protein
MEHGLNDEALLLFKNNREEFQKVAREFTEQNALRVMDNN